MALATMGAIAAIGSAGAAIYGAANSGGGTINGNQNDIAYKNYYLQQALSRRQQEMATASQRDARGNVVRYVDGYGWVEDPTATQQNLNTAADAEQRQQLTGDAVRNRMRLSTNNTRQNIEGVVADGLLDNYQAGGESVDGVRALLANKYVAEATSGADDMRRRIGLQGLRSGGGGSEALAALARRSMPDTRTALATAALEAPAQAASRNNSRETDALNRYSMLAGRASAMPGQTINPAAIPNNGAQTLASKTFAATQGLASARPQTPTLPSIQGGGNDAVNWGSVLQGVGGVLKNQDVRDAYNAWFGSSTAPADRARGTPTDSWRTTNEFGR